MMYDIIVSIVHKIKESLSHRPKDKRIDCFLETIFEEYNLMLSKLNDCCKENILTNRQLQSVEHIEQRILQGQKDYFNGKLMGALFEMQALLQELELIDGLNIRSVKKDEIWYRGRVREESTRLFEKKEMFHIPENLRENVNSQRFSYNGYPCLYLGKSIWACWEELDEPQLDDICFSAFKLTEDIKLFDLSMPTEDNLKSKSIEDYKKILLTLPLAIACSIKTINEKNNFKSEYIIPQLLMAELVNSHPFDGFIFSSTKKNPALDWKEDYLLNMVLPVVGDFDNDGLCIILKKQFTVTAPIYYKYEFLKANVSNMVSVTNEEIDKLLNDSGKPEEIDKNEDLYPRALFGQMEEILNNKDFSAI